MRKKVKFRILIFWDFKRLLLLRTPFKVPCCFPVTIKCKSKDHVNTTSDKPEKFNPFVKKFEFLRRKGFGVFLAPQGRICWISLFYMYLSFIYLDRRPLLFLTAHRLFRGRRVFMQRFKNILIVTNGKKSDRKSLKRAVDLAKRNNADLSLLEVLDVSDREISRLNSKLIGRDVGKLLVEDRIAGIDALLIETDFSLKRLDVVSGVPFIKIIQHVHRYSFDLVITAAEGTRGLKQKIFGTTTLHLMRKCPCPLWVLKPFGDITYKNILAAVDPFEADNVQENLNRKIMELATSMAEIEKADLHVVHVWDVVGESLLLKRGGMTQGAVNTMIAEEKAEHRKALEDLVMEHPVQGIRRKYHLFRGNPGEIIPEYASEKGIDLVVMGTVSRHGIAGLLIGNTAEQVIQRVNASVLTLKPLGFITPVL